MTMVMERLLTNERWQMVQHAIEHVMVSFVSAGSRREEETLAIRVTSEVQRLKSRGVLSEIQAIAAEKLSNAFSAAGLSGMAAMPYMRDYIDRQSPRDEAMIGRLDAVDSYKKAIMEVPLLSWPVVRCVVLDEATIDSMIPMISRNKPTQRQRLITLLQAGLEELAAYYDLKSRKQRKHTWSRE